ncbi:MAG: trpD [Rickettsiaceae bacterium]|jgi:anthranilate phosphoribosyltransferase|nr:trpD [Rickettsiaceae bacterium]
MSENISEYKFLFEQIAAGKLADEEAKNFLLNLNKTGFSSDAFLGAIQAFKPLCKKISSPKNAIDVCGTGGDKLNTLNISTAVAFVVAACGVPVAKHGNKAISSKSGSADVLSELGINISADLDEIEQDLLKNNLCFMFAPLYHSSFKSIAKVRLEIGMPTIFNFLGPLLNPANTQFQLIGTSKKETMLPMLEALSKSGAKKVFIVHGFDGMDEITISDNSLIAKLEDGKIGELEIIDPQNYGIKKVSLDAIKGGDAKYNARKIIELLEGEKSAYRDIVLLNSAFALQVSSAVKTIEDGIKLASEAIDSGKARQVLKNYQKKHDQR